jgi:hypothetical protein
MPSPVFLAFESGETFSSISTLSVVGGVAWGSCTLAYRTLDFRRERLDETGWFVNTPTDRDVYDQFCRLPSDYQERLFLPRRTTTKAVSGFSFGFGPGGAVSLLGEAAEEAIERVAAPALHALVQGALDDLINDTVGAVSNAGGLTVGTAGGFLHMFDAGTFHGMNGRDMFSLRPEQIASYDYCMLQVAFGAGVSASVNLLMLGDFRPRGDYFPMGQNDLERAMALYQYVSDINQRAQAFVVIGEAQAGLILPGGTINIVTT